MENVKVTVEGFKFTDYESDKNHPIAQKALLRYRDWLVEDNWWSENIKEVLTDILKVAGWYIEDIVYTLTEDSDSAWIVGEFDSDFDLDELAKYISNDLPIYATFKKLAELKENYSTLLINTVDWESGEIVVTLDEDESVGFDEELEVKNKAVNLVKEINRWVANNFKDEYEYLTSDEALINHWIDNEVVFDINGRVI